LTARGPVAIGGVGGSGTRVVAHLLAGLGFYLGADIELGNYENLPFALLLNHSTRYEPNRIRRGLEVFERAMTGSAHPRPSDVSFVLRSAYRTGFVGSRRPEGPRFGPRWACRRSAALLRSGSGPHPRWGWKAASTHIHLPYVAEHFHDLRYVHVIRHGLDMAYGHNHSQLHNWGPLVGVAPAESPAELPRAALRYWVEANRRALALGTDLLGERFLLVNYERLCDRPAESVDELLAFLDLSATDEERRRLASIPRSPESRGRYRGHDLGALDPSDIAAVRRFGFQVEGASNLADRTPVRLVGSLWS
jgi:hypothetical protein